jgi:hypothetical protein
MTEDQGEQPADQPERSEEGVEPADRDALTSARAEQGGDPAGEPAPEPADASSAAGAFFAEQARLIGRPADELADEAARRYTGAQAAENIDQLDEALRRAGVGPGGEEPPFEPDDVVDGEGRRGHVRHVSPDEVAAATAAHRPARLDPVSAVAANEAHVRRCEFSRCRKPLPDERRAGRKSDTCDPKDTSWVVGEDKGGKNIVKTCGQMARSERDLAAVIRIQTGAGADGPVGVPALDIVQLDERVDTAIPAVQAALGPINSLLEGLVGVRTQLDQDVAAAHAARDEAVGKATEADSRAETSRRVAVDAEAAKAAAETRAEEAETAARRDRLAKESAERAEAKAEGRASELQDNLERADERIVALAERAEKAAGDLARTQGELTAARIAIEEQAQRAIAQQERANAAVAQAAELERTLRAEFAAELERRAGEQQRALDAARADYDQQLEQARDDFDVAVERVREKAESVRETERRAHAEQLGQLHQQLGGLTQRVETAEADQREANGLVRQLRTALTTTFDALTSTGGDADPARRLAELHERLQPLLDDE